MALQSTGPIGIQDIATEFGGTAPHELSEYYRGGGRVPETSLNAAVAASGTISLGQFYGAVNRPQINILLTTDQQGYVLNTAKASGYVPGLSDVILTVASGVTVGGSTTTLPALDIDTSWASGDTLTLINNGTIAGMGGNGGKGAGSVAGSAGSPGGPGLRAQRAVNVTNNGTIAGGGGGGGGGEVRAESYTDKTGSYTFYYPGGGGGGGRSAGTNSAGGAPGGPSVGGAQGFASAGGAGTNLAPGAGGFRTYYGSTGGGVGGSGGAYGAAGASGAASTGGGAAGAGPYAGGAAGAAVLGNSNITWNLFGTRLGAVT